MNQLSDEFASAPAVLFEFIDCTPRVQLENHQDGFYS